MAPDVAEIQLNEVFPIADGVARCGHKHFPIAAANNKRPWRTRTPRIFATHGQPACTGRSRSLTAAV
jgi:hypothetical protein